MNGEQRYKKVYKVTGLSVIKQHTQAQEESKTEPFQPCKTWGVAGTPEPSPGAAAAKDQVQHFGPSPSPGLPKTSHSPCPLSENTPLLMKHIIIGIWKAIMFLQNGDTLLIASFNLTYLLPY